MSDEQRLREDAAALAPDLVRLRRRLHRRPEVGLQLPATQETVLAELAGLDLEVTRGREVTSVVAVLRGGRPGPAVLLRGDMDALPVTEATGLDFASEVPGAMHACGHDLHTAALVGAARLLAARRAELAGDVVLMFQPGEEGWDGAGAMLAEGVLDAAGRPLTAAYGLHVVAARFARGVFTTRPGPLLAASDKLLVTVHGEGGHGSAPHRGRDPVVAAAEIVSSLQAMVTRRFDVFDPVVLTIGSLHAGTAHNVIPDVAELAGTVRSFSSEARERMRTLAPEVCRQVGAAHGVRVSVDYQEEYPLTVNDAAETDFVAGVVRDVFGADRYQPLPQPMTGAEDFSRVLAAVPGCFVFLGAHAGGGVEAADNHSPRAVFDDAVLGDAALLLASLALRRTAAAASSPTG